MKLRRYGPATFLALIVLCLTPLTYAQRWPSPTPPALPGGAPRILEPAPGEPVISEGLIRRGEVFAAFPVQYVMVGRLQNDIHRFAPITGAPSLLFPAGTVVFRAQLTLPAGLAHQRALGPARWCGVARPRDVARAFCWQTEDYVHEPAPDKGLLGYVRSDFPVYFPVGRGLVNISTATLPQIALDDSARAELPPMEFVYVLNNPQNCSAYVRAGIRIGGEVQVFSGVSYGCDADKGIIGFPAGDGFLRLTAVGNDAATLSITQAPTTYVHPNERSRIFE